MPKSFTQRRENLNHKAIYRKSQIWEELDQCGTKSYEVDCFHSQLRHFVVNNKIIDDDVPGDELGDEENIGFNQIDETEAD